MRIAKLKDNALQFAHFSLIGAMNGTLDLIILNILLMLWHNANMFDLFVINSVAYLAAVLNSYFWNAKLTFRKESVFSTKEKTSFAAQALVSLFISNGVFLLFNYLLGFSPFPLWVIHNGSKGISMASSSICSYIFMKVYVFKGSRA